MYGQGVSEQTSVLPPGWRDRLVAVRNPNTNGATGWCLDPHDLAVAKLVAGREKDGTFLRALFEARSIDPELVRSRLDDTDLAATPRTLAEQRLAAWSTGAVEPPR